MLSLLCGHMLAELFLAEDFAQAFSWTGKVQKPACHVKLFLPVT
jgi:hypothetical protein